MKNAFICTFVIFLLFSAIANAKQTEVIVLTLGYNKGDISLKNIRMDEIAFNEKKSNPKDNYRLDYISYDEQLTYSLKFHFPLEIDGSPPNPDWFDERGNQIVIPRVNKSERILERAFAELIIPLQKKGRFIRIFNEKNKQVLEVDLIDYFDNGQKSNFMVYFTPIAALAFLIIAIYIFRKRRAKMSDMKNFIAKAKENGSSDSQIKDILAKKGATEKEIKSTKMLNKGI